MIPATFLLIGGPLLLALVVYLVRRLTVVAAPLSAAGALALAWLTSIVPQSANEVILGGRVVGGAQTVLGRTLNLSAADQQILVVMSVTAAVILLLAGRLRPGDVFFPGMLALLGVLAAVLVTETFIFAVFMVEVAAGVTTALLQGSRFGSTRGAWRFFLFVTLAMPLLLVAGWQIDFQAANPMQSNLLSPAVLLLTLGFLIYLAAAPFHLWLAPVAGEAHPFPQMAALGFFQITVLALVSSALHEFPWYAGSSLPFQWFTFAGVLTAGLGALLTFSAERLGQLAAYNLLVDGGTVLLALGLGRQEGLTAAWSVLFLRLISLVIWESGLAVLRSYYPGGLVAPGRLQRRNWTALLGVGLLIFGGLSLAGFPLTPGFAGRWMAAGLVARADLGRALVVLAGTVSGTVGVLRTGRALLTLSDQDEPVESGRWRWLTIAAMILVFLAGLSLALYPTPLLTAARQVAAQFSLPN